MTNELDGRALAEAAARAMGWHFAPVARMWVDSEGIGRFYEEEELNLTDREMLAWLHKHGEVEAYSNSRGASAALWYPDISDGVGGCKVGGTSPTAHGRDLLEALQRLVVAVAAREVKQ